MHHTASADDGHCWRSPFEVGSGRPSHGRSGLALSRRALGVGKLLQTWLPPLLPLERTSANVTSQSPFARDCRPAEAMGDICWRLGGEAS
jgi:hypothetical protein